MRRLLLAILAVAATVGSTAPAAAVDADVYRRGVRWCASTYAGHGGLEGFGPPLDINYSEHRNDHRAPLFAPGPGRVRIYSRGWGGGWGNSVIWRSADGREEIQLAHLDSFGRRGRVKAGDLIGRVGNTGSSDGSHLHTARRVGGKPAPLRLMGRIIRAGRCYTSIGPLPPRCAGRVATIVGTRGADVLRGTKGRDVIAGLAGNDRILGGGGNDLVCGHDGKDDLRGRGGRDRLLGGAGADRLEGGSGNDRLQGGAGPDLALHRAAPRAVRIDLSEGSASGHGTDSLRGIERLSGTPWADSLTGNARPNRLRGRGGDDTLDGADGEDMLDGGPDVDSCVDGETTRRCEVPLSLG